MVEGKFLTNSYFFLIIDSWRHIGILCLVEKIKKGTEKKDMLCFIFFLTGTISFTILNLAFSFLLPHNVLTNMKLVTDCRTLHIYYFYAALFYYLAEVLENKAKKYAYGCCLHWN